MKKWPQQAPDSTGGLENPVKYNTFGPSEADPFIRNAQLHLNSRLKMSLTSPKQHFTSYFAGKMTSYKQEILRIYRVSESPSKNDKNGGRGLQDCLLGAFWGGSKNYVLREDGAKKYEKITLKKASIKPLKCFFWPHPRENASF